MILTWKPTKFHRHNSAHLLDQAATDQLIDQLAKRYKINTELGFKSPGFKYFKFLKPEDMESIKRYPHLVTANYGLNPIWLLWLTTINGVHYNLYINLVTRQIIWSRHRFAPELYQGTMLEGEMINDTFRIWDLLIHKNRPVSTMDYNLNKRLDIIRGMLTHRYTPDPLVDNVTLDLRIHVPIHHLKSYLNYLDQNPPFKNRPLKGLFIVPIGRSLKTYTMIFNSHHNQRNSTFKSNPDLEFNPQLPPTLPMIHPETGQSQIETFWLQPVENSNDNYWQYARHPEHPNDPQLYRLGLVITTTLAKSLRIKHLFSITPTITRSGIRNLLPFKCQYIKRFIKWEPLEIDQEQLDQNES